MASATAFFSSHSLSSSLALRLARASTQGFPRSHSLRVELAHPFPLLHGSIASGGSGLLGKIRGSDSQSSMDSADTSGSSFSMSDREEEDVVPMPIVLIDQDSDPDATIVQLSFGDRLGALVDMMKALRDLGLRVTKGSVTTEPSVVQTKFFITQLDLGLDVTEGTVRAECSIINGKFFVAHFHRGRKVEDPAMLEKIRLTIINKLLEYHPESSEKLAMGEFFGIKPPEKLDVDIATHIFVEDDGPKRSLLYIETADRPGLLLEIIKIIIDINIDVESAEINTEGLVAKDKFHVSYRGAALNNSLLQLLTNCLRYYLRRPEIEEDSY